MVSIDYEHPHEPGIELYWQYFSDLNVWDPSHERAATR